MPSNRASTADKFSTLFDNDWKHNKSTIRQRTERIRTYDPTYSWDARSDNPQSFSRLQATEMPFQPANPVTMSGHAVIQLETIPGFDAINVQRDRKETSKVPLTWQQRDLAMKNDLTGSIPFVKDAVDSNKVVLVEERTTFKNSKMIEPSLSAQPVPDFMIAAGPQCDQKLLNPKQRRMIMEFEKKKAQADELIRTATSQRIKTKKQMSGQQFHRGVLMVDSSDNLDSEVYGERAKHKLEADEIKHHNHNARRENLASKQGSMHTNGNILIPDSVAPHVRINKDYQSKGGEYHGFTVEETHNRLFCKHNETDRLLSLEVSYGDRTQRLRDTELRGKGFNITQHTTLEYYPPRFNNLEAPSRVMSHPSQQSLEMQRSLQGHVQRY